MKHALKLLNIQELNNKTIVLYYVLCGGCMFMLPLCSQHRILFHVLCFNIISRTTHVFSQFFKDWSFFLLLNWVSLIFQTFFSPKCSAMVWLNLIMKDNEIFINHACKYLNQIQRDIYKDTVWLILCHLHFLIT
jgi:hypothetical protein